MDTSTATPGVMGVDWEARVDFDRLRSARLARLRAQLEASELGALLAFDFANIRYMTATHIGTWAMDKFIRFALVTRHSDPISWDFGSAARHHDLHNPWLHETTMDQDAEPGSADRGGGRRPRAESGARPGLSVLRGAFHPDAGIAEALAAKIRRELDRYGLLGEPLGVDIVELPVLAALQAAGITVVDGQQVFMEARRIKTPDEITLLSTAASMVDAAYENLYEFLRPGVRENETVGLVSKTLYDLGSEYVEGVNAISGERCSPTPTCTPTASSAPATPRSSTSSTPSTAIGPATTGRSPSARPPGRRRTPTRGPASTWTTRWRWCVRVPPPADVVSVWPRAQEFGFPDEEAAFALQYGHGVGLSIWEKPIFSRLVSLDHPEVLEEGMVFALETYWPSADGIGAARIEEEVVVTGDGCEVITKFPAQELMVAGGHRYFTVDGPMKLLTEPLVHHNVADEPGTAS